MLAMTNYNNSFPMSTPMANLNNIATVSSQTHQSNLTNFSALFSSLVDDDDHPLSMTSDCIYSNENDVKTMFANYSASSITIMHINCRSVAKNWDSILLLLDKLIYPLTVIAVTETWLNDSIVNLYNIPGYKLVSNSRVSKHGGGVGLYVHARLDFVVRSDLAFMLPDIESIFVEITQANSKKNIIVGAIYRPPNTELDNFIVHISSILSVLGKEPSKPRFITGDFNLDLLKYETHLPTNDFLNSFLEHAYLPLITKPTRVTEYSATLIDNIFTNAYLPDCNARIIINDISDHFPIIMQINLGINLNYKNIDNPPRRLFNPHLVTKFRDELYLYDWDLVFNESPADPNICYNRFHATFSALYEKAFPVSIRKSPKQKSRQP
jgi:hypothetical protein